jgi:hypothetical protein
MTWFRRKHWPKSGPKMWGPDHMTYGVAHSLPWPDFFSMTPAIILSERRMLPSDLRSLKGDNPRESAQPKERSNA